MWLCAQCHNPSTLHSIVLVLCAGIMSSHSQSCDNAKSSSIAPSMAIVAHIGLPGQCQCATAGGRSTVLVKQRERETQQKNINKETKNSKTERSNKYAKPREAATQTGLVSAATLPSALFWGSNWWMQRSTLRGDQKGEKRCLWDLKGKWSWNWSWRNWTANWVFFLGDGRWHSISCSGASLIDFATSPLPSFPSSFFTLFLLWYLLAVTASVLVHLGGQQATNNAQPKWTV